MQGAAGEQEYQADGAGAALQKSHTSDFSTPFGPGAKTPGVPAPRFRIQGRWFPLEIRRYRVAELELELQVPVYDSQSLDSVVAEKGWSERDWPYWLEDWPATLGLIEALAGETGGWPGPVLDLGCGSGLLTRYLASRFPEVFACDINGEACRLTRLNLPPVPPGCKPPWVLRADLNRTPFRIRFGLVVVGELLYDHALAGQVLAFLRTALAPEGIALLADAGRFTADDVPGRAEALGFEVHVLKTDPAGSRRIFALSHPGRELHLALSRRWMPPR